MTERFSPDAIISAVAVVFGYPREVITAPYVGPVAQKLAQSCKDARHFVRYMVYEFADIQMQQVAVHCRSSFPAVSRSIAKAKRHPKREEYVRRVIKVASNDIEVQAAKISDEEIGRRLRALAKEQPRLAMALCVVADDIWEEGDAA